MSEIENSGDWQKKEMIEVGGKKLALAELSIAKRDAVVSVLFTDLEVVSLVKPLMDAIKKKSELRAKLSQLILEGKASASKMVEDDDDFELDMGDLLEQVKTVLLGLLKKKLTMVQCISLDTQVNRKVIGREAKVEEDEEHHFEYSPPTFKWISNHMAISQEQVFLDKFLHVNDFLGLVKNYKTLVVSQLEAARVLSPKMED